MSNIQELTAAIKELTLAVKALKPSITRERLLISRDCDDHRCDLCVDHSVVQDEEPCASCIHSPEYDVVDNNCISTCRFYPLNIR